MLNVKFEGELAEEIEKQACREKKDQAAIVRHAIEAYLEAAQDHRDVLAVKRRREKRVALKEAGRRLGLER